MTAELSNQGRLKSADILKGMIMVTIVIAHLLWLGPSKGEGSRDTSIILQVLYLGLLSFFIISGYFYKPGRSFKENMRKRSMQLLVALIVCSIVLPIALYAWFLILGQPQTTDDLWLSILAGLGLTDIFEPSSTVPAVKVCYSAYVHYFLWTMFWSFIVFYSIADRILEDRRKLVASLIGLLVLQAILVVWGMKLPFFINLTPIAISLMIMGAFLSRQKLLERLESSKIKNPKFWGLLIASAVTVAVLAILSPPGIKFDHMYFGDNGWISVFPFFVESVLVFIILSYFALLISKIPGLKQIFSLCGRHSLGLALFHVFVAKVIVTIFYTMPTTSTLPAMPTTTLILLGVADIAIILILIELTNRLSLFNGDRLRPEPAMVS